jgi:hypothetical protein
VKSKKWIKDKQYPPGPVLLSSLSGFLKGSGNFKSDMLAQLKRDFQGIEIGIGDKISDVQAYHENGLKAFLVILKIDEEKHQALEDLADALQKLPEGIQVVRDWDQLEKALFEGAVYPAFALEKYLREKAQKLRDAEEASKEK